MTTDLEELTAGSTLPWEVFFRNHRAVMLLVEPDGGVIVDANPSACAWYGWTHEELCGKRISDINTLSPDEIRSRIEQARREECEFFDFRHRVADGSIRDVVVYSTPVQVRGHTLLHSIIQDVTERARAEAALRRSEALRDVAEHAARIGSFRWPLDGSQAAWSREVYELFDVRPGEFGYDLPRAVEARVHPDDAARLMKTLRRVAQEREAFSEEVRVMAGGDYLTMRIGAVPEIGDGGDVVSVAGYVQDVTEQRRAEGELRLVYERLDIAQQAAGAGAFQFHADTREFAFSPQMYSLFGLDPQEHPGTFDTLRAVVHPDDIAATWEAYASALRDHTQLQIEYRIIRPSDGELRWIDSLGHGRYDEAGRPQSLIGLCTDVTDRKRTETLLSVPSEILAILAEGGHADEMARKIVDAVRRASGFAAVGLRLRDGEDYPFIAATGYSAEFLELEGSLAAPAPGGRLVPGAGRQCEPGVHLRLGHPWSADPRRSVLQSRRQRLVQRHPRRSGGAVRRRRPPAAPAQPLRARGIPLAGAGPGARR